MTEPKSNEQYDTEQVKFNGFTSPQQNYSKLPHEFIESMHLIDSLAEMKVVLYILRHTWGFSEYDKPKKITTAEFANGRKKKDGDRLDKGTGLSDPSIRSGLEKAIEHGFIEVAIDKSDMGRQKKFYSLNMSKGKDFTPDSKDFTPCLEESYHRTEKETKEINKRKGSENLPLDWKIAAGLEITQSDLDQEKTELDALLGFEQIFGYGTLPWNSTSTWDKFAKFVVKCAKDDPGWPADYVQWREGEGKYKAFSNRKIRENPQAFIDTGYPEYDACKMYREKDDYHTRQVNRMERL